MQLQTNKYFCINGPNQTISLQGCGITQLGVQCIAVSKMTPSTSYYVCNIFTVALFFILVVGPTLATPPSNPPDTQVVNLLNLHLNLTLDCMNNAQNGVEIFCDGTQTFLSTLYDALGHASLLITGV